MTSSTLGWRIASLIASLLLLACSGTPEPVPEPIPDPPTWYPEGRNDTGTYWYGAGSGFTPDKARKDALLDVAERIRVRVEGSETFRDVYTKTTEQGRLVEQGGQTTARREIRSVVEGIQFAAFQEIDTAKAGGEHYALIKVDKARTREQQRAAFRQLDSELKNDFQRLQEADSLVERLKQADQVEQKLEKARLVVLVLDALDPATNAGEILSGYTRITDAIERTRTRIRFYVTGDESSRFLVEKLREQLNQTGFQIADRRSGGGSNLAIVDVQSDVRSDEHFGAQVIRLDATLYLRAPDGGVLSSHQMRVSGSSNISREDALRGAAADFEKRLAEQGVLASLGLESSR